MGENFSENTIDKVVDTLCSLPKEKLEQEHVRFWEAIDREDLTEEMVLKLVENLA